MSPRCVDDRVISEDSVEGGIRERHGAHVPAFDPHVWIVKPGEFHASRRKIDADHIDPPFGKVPADMGGRAATRVAHHRPFSQQPGVSVQQFAVERFVVEFLMEHLVVTVSRQVVSLSGPSVDFLKIIHHLPFPWTGSGPSPLVRVCRQANTAGVDHDLSGAQGDCLGKMGVPA